MYGKLEKLTERLLAKLHPPNLVNIMFYLVLIVTISKLSKIQFWKMLFAVGSHKNTVISDRFAYPSGSHQKP